MADDTSINSFTSRLRRLLSRALPFQPARRRRKLRSGGGRAFIGVVTGCARDSSGWMEITGKKLTASPYAFETGAEFTAWAGIDPLIVNDAMVLVVSIEPLKDDPSVTNYAVPHIPVHPAYLDEPDEACQSAFGTACDPNWPQDPCA